MSGETKPLPAIPAKRYFTIGEVSELCGVKAYVLRYWEQEFTQLKPMKRSGNRRYYQHHEVLLIRRIRDLLYAQGFTINGARNQLGEAGQGRGAQEVPLAVLEGADVSDTAPEPVVASSDPASSSSRTTGRHPSNAAADSMALREELLAIRALLVG